MEENRVEIELRKWDKIEDRLKTNHKSDISLNRAFRLEKLAALERIGIRIRKEINPMERIDLRILREEKRKIEKELYPNFFLRMARRFIVRIAFKGLERKYQRERQTTSEHLNRQMDKLGLGELKDQIAAKVSLGHSNFSLDHQVTINAREKVLFQIKVDSNADGSLKLEKVTANLLIAGKETGRSHRVNLDAREKFSLEAIGNLLAGRSVQASIMDGQAGEAKWQVFDLNDRDSQGSYRLKEVTSKLDLHKELKQLSTEVKLNAEDIWNITAQLEKGRLVELPKPVGPEREEVMICYNASKGKVEAYHLSGKKFEPAKKEEPVKKTVVKKLDDPAQKQVTKTRIAR